jgi:methyl-accepting chemotaxis protein
MANQTKMTIQGRVLRALTVLLGAVFLLSSLSLYTMYQAQIAYKSTREELKENRDKFRRLYASLDKLGSVVDLHVAGKPFSKRELEFSRQARNEFIQAIGELGGTSSMRLFPNEIANINQQFEATTENSAAKDFSEIRESIAGIYAQVAKSHESELVDSVLNLIYLIMAVAFATIVIPAGSLWLTTEKINNDLYGFVRSLYQFSGENQLASEELEAASLELSSSSNQQSAAVQQTVASITEIRSMLSESENHIMEVRDLTTTMNEKTQDGAKIMAQVEAAMQAIEQANGQLESFKEMILAIRGKTRVINDIVFKTQLLSFNASIEAARAGQYGRGFSVVAEEVGKLAQISGDASKEIDSLLGTSQDRVVKIVEAVQVRVSDGKSISHEAMKRFGEIAREIATISDKISQVSDASIEQAGGVEQTARAMDQMNETTQKNKQSAEQVNKVGRRVQSLSHEIRDVSAGIRRFVREGKKSDLDEAVAKLPAVEVAHVPVLTRRTDDAAVLKLVNKIAQKKVEPNGMKTPINEISPDDASFRKSGQR